MIRRYLLDIMQDRRDTWVTAPLIFLAWLYGRILSIHRWGYDRGWFPVCRPRLPVISVGNLTLGGVGKTPLVELIVRHVAAQGRRPAILIRGYHSRRGPEGRASDESEVLRENLNDVAVLVGADRVAGARRAEQAGDVDVLVMDDGFQHRRLHRDLDILAIDATNPFGNGCLMPRGILREPLSALRRADLIVLTKADWGADRIKMIEDTLTAQGVNVPIVHAAHRPRVLLKGPGRQPQDVETIRNKRVCLLSAIGDPAGFERIVTDLGAHVIRHAAFSDHHWFTQKEMDDLTAFCRDQPVNILVTTAKDAVRLKPFAGHLRKNFDYVILDLQLKLIHGREKFFQRIDVLLHR